MSEPEHPRACVVGWPVSHSRSPMIHGYWLRKYGVEGGYERAPVRPEGFAEFVAGIGRSGLRGANVTVPHKEAAFALCDRRTPVAEAMGAVNTLWREGAVLWGDNTDVGGFLASLDEEAPRWRESVKVAAVLGAGGAARAVVHALLSSGVERVLVVNRTPERAEALCRALGKKATAMSLRDFPGEVAAVDLLVNATTLGMAGQPALDFDVSRLKGSAIVADIVYIPLATPLVEDARARGLIAVGGLGMLLHQAAPGFERWFGLRPAVTRELRDIVEADIVAAEAKRL